MENPLLKGLRHMLRPVARYCLRSSLGLQELLEMSKVVLLEVAAEEMIKNENKINISRLSAMTGVHRKDAVRIYREKDVNNESTRFVSRVVGQWRQDPRFLNDKGKPKPLSFRGEDSEFSQLVVLVSQDLHPGTVLFELERLGAVKRVKEELQLLVKAYVPRGNPVEGLRMLGEDAEDLANAVLENIFNDGKEAPNYHAKAVYDNVAEEDVPQLRSWLFKQASQFHQKVSKYLSKYDLDINPNPKKKGGKRVVLGIFTKT
jgi:hypothetical protein